MQRLSVTELLAGELPPAAEVERRLAAMPDGVLLYEDRPEPPWLGAVRRHRGGLVPGGRRAVAALLLDIQPIPPLSLDEEREWLARVEPLRSRRRQAVLRRPEGLRAALNLLGPDDVAVPHLLPAAVRDAAAAHASGDPARGDAALAELLPRPGPLRRAAARAGLATDPWFTAADAEVRRAEERLWAHELRLVIAIARELHGADLEAWGPAVERALVALGSAVETYSHRFGGRLSAFCRPPVERAARGG